MKEAMGATWIFTIVLTFIILMTAYLAISVNYAKAFKIKSYIVSSIEENNGQGYTEDLGREIDTYLTAQGYAVKGSCPKYLKLDRDTSTWERIDKIQPDNYDEEKCGIGIYRSPVSTANDDIEANRYYYRVVAFFKFDLPVVNFLTTFNVSGETRYVYDMTGGVGR